MMKAAISTFGGVDTKTPRSRALFEGEVAKAAAPECARLAGRRAADSSGSEQVLTIQLSDAKGAPVAGVAVQPRSLIRSTSATM